MKINKIVEITLTLFLIVVSYIFPQGLGRWEETDSLLYLRRYHTSVKLNDGRILVIGGSEDSYIYDGIKECEIFDPAINKWFEAVAMNIGRTDHASIKMADGNILVCGGNAPADSDEYMLTRTEIYYPDSNIWVQTDSMKVQRIVHEIVKLNDGRIMVVGGRTIVGEGPAAEEGATETCEIYNPETGKWKLTKSLSMPRTGHRAVLLPNGKVLVSGGSYWGGPNEPSCEIFDPATETWINAAPMNVGRNYHSAILLDNQKILVIGGNSETCEVYDYLTDSWVFVIPQKTNLNKALKMLNCNVFIVNLQNSLCAIYNPILDEWNSAVSLPYKNSFGEINLLDDGRILLSGGYFSGVNKNKAFIYYPDSITSVVDEKKTITSFKLSQN